MKTKRSPICMQISMLTGYLMHIGQTSSCCLGVSKKNLHLLNIRWVCNKGNTNFKTYCTYSILHCKLKIVKFSVMLEYFIHSLGGLLGLWGDEEEVCGFEDPQPEKRLSKWDFTGSYNCTRARKRSGPLHRRMVPGYNTTYTETVCSPQHVLGQ